MKRNHFIRCFQFLALAVLLWLPVRSTAQPCLLSIPLPNTASDYIAANPPWFHRDYLAAHNASTLTNHVFSDTAGVAPGPYLAWCVDLPDDINGAGATYNATFFSSCDPNLDSELPLNYPSSVYVSPDTWRQINYILNHKKGAYFFDVQVAIWNLIGGPIPQEIYGGNAAGYPNLVTNGVNDVNELLSDALANADSWEPSCGDVISVIVAVNVTPHDQLTIIEIPYPCIPSVAVTKVVACLEANGDCGNFSHQAAGYTASSCGTGPALPAFCYDITVTNTGSIPLTNLTVVDNLLQPHDLTPFFFPSPTTVLAPGEALTGKFTMAFAANATNTVTVQGQAHIGHSVTNVGGIVVTNGMPVSAGDKAVALVDNASISCDVTLTSPLDLDSSPSDNHVLLPSTTSSSTVTFNVTIKNTGSSDLVGITLAGLSTLNCAMPAPFELAAGQSTNIQLCVQIVNCPGSTFNISVTAQVGSDATHCAVLTSSGAPIYVCSSCLGMVEYTAGVSGEVLLHCNGSSADFSTDLGLGNVSVTLLDSSSNFVATTVTDNSGSYSFNNLAAGNYIVKVNLGAPYVETYPAGNTSGQISVALVPCNATGVDFGYADTTPPSVHVNPGSDYGCNPTVIISDADERTNVTASVSCGTTNVSVTHLDATNLCSASRVFTIIVSDTYGNSVTNTATYTWTVNGQPPSITVPPGYDLACNPAVIPDDSAISNTVNVTGNCSSAATFTVTHVDGAVDCAASRVFTINAVDSCGNKASTTVTYTWTVNKVPPTITVPPGSDLACNPASIPDDNAVSNTVAVTGNCGSATTFTVSHTDNVLNCAASRVFTITATDACGNINTAMVTYTWTANRVPPSITVPPGSDLACNPASIPDDSAISNTVAVTGNCGSLTTFTVTHVDGAVDCAASRVFTIMATDACGNVNSTTVTYTWTANKVPPSITVPPGSDLACNPTSIPDDSAISNTVAVTGNCGSPTTFTVTHVDGAVDCAAGRVFTITATDACGNINTATVTYTWTANKVAPTISVPPGSDLACNPTTIPDDLAVSNTVIITGNCASKTSFTVSHQDNVVNCAASRVFTINAIDACGNTASTTVTYTWTANKVNPTLSGIPASGDLGCNPPSIPTCASIKALITANGNCGSATTVTVTSPGATINNCAASQTFNISAVDSCGNTATAAVTYTWTANKVNPTLSGVPAGGPLGCNPPSLPTCASVKALISATGNCGSPVTVTVTTPGATINNCAASQTFNISAVDACGNTATAAVTYTWTANKVNPTLNGVPPGGPLGCNPPSLPTCASVKALITAIGNCGSPVTVTVTTPGVTVNNCAASQVFNISAVDSCGNTATAAVTYTWTANKVNPTLSGVPAGGPLGCNPTSLPTCASIKALITGHGNCGSPVTVTVTTPGVTINNCAASQTFNISGVDSCGNTATAAVTYTWTANKVNPTLSGVPANTNLGCNPAAITSDAAIKGLISATGNCGSTVIVTVTHVDSTNGCLAQRLFVVTATDSCNNSSAANVIYSWTIDIAGPTIICPPDLTVVTNCHKVYCTFCPSDWSGPCNSGYNGYGSYGNSWWNSWNNYNNNSDCGSSFNNWWKNCDGDDGGGSSWWSSWNAQNCGSGWWSGWTGSSYNNWWGSWNRCNYGSQSFVPCAGSNPGSVLCDNFSKVYSNGCVKIGKSDGYCLTFNSSSAVQNCLGFGGNPGVLNCSAVNPKSCSAGSFCAGVLALQLNCDYGDSGCGNSHFFGSCGDLVLCDPTSPCNGKRVRDICAIANCALGGGSLPPGCTVSNLCNLVNCLNQSFQGCKVSSWCSSHLCPVHNPSPINAGYPTILGGCSTIVSSNYSDVVTPLSCAGSYVITRTWTATDACGVSNSCQQTITIVQSPSSTVTGKVVQACAGDSDLSNNQALANVTVTLKSGTSTVATDTTDSSGNYEFDNLTAGTYTVVVTPPSGYTETSPTDNKNTQSVTVGACQSSSVATFGYTGSTPGIQLTKSGPVCATNGQTIAYTFKVCNTGNTCLSVSVSDPLLGGVIYTKTGVAPGQSLLFTNNYTINAAKGACALTNVATATGTAPNGKTATSTDNAITCLTTKSCVSTICGSFNSSNPGSGYVWCNAHLSSYPKQKCNVFCQQGTVTLKCNNGKTYTYQVPDCKITFDPSCSSASSSFDGSCWNTTLPCNGDDEILLSACGIPWNSDFVGCKNVCWTANFCSDYSGFNCNWQWGASCYKNDLSDCSSANPKPCHTTYCQGFSSGDHACTPQNYKSYCVAGGTGSGGSSYCGNWTSSASVTCK